jgi:hypothetical protein
MVTNLYLNGINYHQLFFEIYSRCPEFFAKFASQKEYTVTDISYEVFLQFVKYVYSDIPPNSKELAEQLKNFGIKYSIQSLINICDILIANETVTSSRQLQTDFQSGFKEDELCDVTFEVEGGKLSAHKVT